jgi:exfoliative toxin A/B
MEKVIKKIPVPITGLALALAAAGNLLLSYGSIYRNIFGSISALILVLFIIKIFIDPKDILESIKNPIIASTLPTFTMCLMLLANYIKPNLPTISFGVWTFGLLLHCFLIVCFTVKFIFNFHIRKVFPSYFIVYVGMAVASITAPSYNLIGLGKAVFWFAFISYLCLLPIVIYRIFIIKAISEPAVPTITIFAAPASLCLVGYIGSFQEKSIVMVGLLAALSLLMFIGVLLYLPKMLKIKFYPSYSAFTFPLVISSLAMKQTSGLLVKMNKPIYILKYLIKFQEILAVLIVVYVLIKYFVFLFHEDIISKNSEANKVL